MTTINQTTLTNALATKACRDDGEYPNRGFCLIQPSFGEMQLTGDLATIQFTRKGHRYSVLLRRTLPVCKKDGHIIAWDDLNSIAQSVAHKAAEFLRASQKLSA